MASARAEIGEFTAISGWTIDTISGPYHHGMSIVQSYSALCFSFRLHAERVEPLYVEPPHEILQRGGEAGYMDGQVALQQLAEREQASGWSR